MKPLQTLLLGLAALSLSACRHHPSSNGVHERTNYLPVDTANLMIQSYLTSIPSGDTNRVISMIVDADDLRYYLSDTSIKGIKLMLAHPLSYIHAGNEGIDGGLNSSALTVVLAGFNSNGNYVLSPDNMVLNKVLRCPPFCLSSGNAGSNLIE